MFTSVMSSLLHIWWIKCFLQVVTCKCSKCSKFKSNINFSACWWQHNVEWSYIFLLTLPMLTSSHESIWSSGIFFSIASSISYNKSWYYREVTCISTELFSSVSYMLDNYHLSQLMENTFLSHKSSKDFL